MESWLGPLNSSVTELGQHRAIYQVPSVDQHDLYLFIYLFFYSFIYFNTWIIETSCLVDVDVEGQIHNSFYQNVWNSSENFNNMHFW